MQSIGILQHPPSGGEGLTICKSGQNTFFDVIMLMMGGANRPNMARYDR
jgi:hypothetical protein